MAARGLTKLPVAETLFVSGHTVEGSRVRRVRQLGIGSRRELAAWAVAHRQGQS